MNENEKDLCHYDSERDFTSLEAWKNTRTVKLFFYEKVVPILPDSEKFNLGSQIKRASISITANIAEGYGRYHYTEGIQFYRISRGSLYELKDHLQTCLDLHYIDKEIFNNGLNLIEKAKISLNGFINYTRKKIP